MSVTFIIQVQDGCYMSVFINPSPINMMRHKANFQVEFNLFEFRVFLPLDWLPNQG